MASRPELAEAPPDDVIVAVFHQDDCGHCEEYIPRFEAVAGKFPDVSYVLANIDSKQGAAYVEKFGVRLTPTTMILRKGGKSEMHEGQLSDLAIEIIFLKAKQK